MKAITTKYHGPGAVRGSRISATAEGGNRITIPYPHDLSGEAVHRAAAEALCKKLDWPGKLIGGGTKDGYVFVFAPADNTEINAELLAVAQEVVRWAKTPGNHGGNPYGHKFVGMAEMALDHVPA